MEKAYLSRIESLKENKYLDTRVDMDVCNAKIPSPEGFMRKVRVNPDHSEGDRVPASVPEKNIFIQDN